MTLKSGGGGNADNRIQALDLDQLLLYNGLDAYWEHLMAEREIANGALGIKV